MWFKSQLTKAKERADALMGLYNQRGDVIAEMNSTIGKMETALAERERSNLYLSARLSVSDAKVAEAQGRLASIIAMETPGMANVGKRMIKAAKGLK